LECPNEFLIRINSTGGENITETIWKNGHTQIIRFTALADNLTAFTGTNTGDDLPGAIVVYSENRSTGWIDQVIENPVVKWQAENVAIWEAELPSSYITLSSGNGTLQVSGTGMKMVTIPLIIGGSATGGGRVIKDFTHNAVGKTIQFTDTTITKADILKITGVDSNMKIYDSENPTRGKNISQVEGTPGLFSYEYGGVPTGETLQIIVC